VKDKLDGGVCTVKKALPLIHSGGMIYFFYLHSALWQKYLVQTTIERGKPLKHHMCKYSKNMKRRTPIMYP
jgi:hypothetical protein